MFILAVGALSRRSGAGARRLLSSRAALPGAPSVPWLPPTAEPCQAGLFLLLYQKRDSPAHFLHPRWSAARAAPGLSRCLWRRDVQTHPPGASQGLLFLLRVKCGLQADTERGRSDAHGDGDAAVL